MTNETKIDILDELGLSQPLDSSQLVPVESQTDLETKTKQMIQSDFELSRDKLTSLIETGQEAIENFKDVALETQEPRAYEVLATLLKNTGDLTKALMDNAKIKTSIDKDQKIQQKPSTEQQGPITNSQTNIFVGTTKDLKDFLKAQQQEVVIEHKDIHDTDNSTSE